MSKVEFGALVILLIVCAGGYWSHVWSFRRHRAATANGPEMMFLASVAPDILPMPTLPWDQPSYREWDVEQCNVCRGHGQHGSNVNNCPFSTVKCVNCDGYGALEVLRDRDGRLVHARIVTKSNRRKLC